MFNEKNSTVKFFCKSLLFQYVINLNDVAMSIVMDPVPVTGLAANFSPIPHIAPPPLGKKLLGV